MASLAQLDLWLSAARTLRHVQEQRAARYGTGPAWEELVRLGAAEERLERAVRRRERQLHRGSSWAEARRLGDEGLDR